MRAGGTDVLARPVGARLLVDAVRNALDVSAASSRQSVGRRRLQERYAEDEVTELSTARIGRAIARSLLLKGSTSCRWR